MPSADSSNHFRHFGEIGKYGTRLDYKKPQIYDDVGGITILDSEGKLFPRVHEILDVIADADAAVATSHLNLNESRALVKEARRRGIRAVVTHAKFITASLTVEDQKWMADQGALIELCYSSLSPSWRNASIDDVAREIREVGPEHYILASDLGQVHNPPAPEGLRIYVMMLLERGIEYDEIRAMVKGNTEKLLGLD
jgi:hypothetical protein